MFLYSVGIDGRVNVWKISEGPDEEDKPQITGKTVIAVQIVGEGEIKNPRVCWHCYKQVLHSLLFPNEIVFAFIFFFCYSFHFLAFFGYNLLCHTFNRKFW